MEIVYIVSVETVSELKRRIAQLEVEESKDAWQEWYDKGVVFLNSIVGRVFAYWGGSSLVIFKVLSYKTQQVWTQRASGYFEIKTEGYFNIYSAKHIYGAGLQIPYTSNTPYGCFEVDVPKFTARNKKAMSQIDYKGMSLSNSCCVQTHKVTKIGRYITDDKGKIDSNHYAVCTPKPKKSVKDEFCSQVYEVPLEMYNEALEMANELVGKTNDYWNKYEKVLKEAKRI